MRGVEHIEEYHNFYLNKHFFLAACVPQPTATLEHVEMAIQLFTKATMDAVKSGVTQYNIASDPQVRGGSDAQMLPMSQ